MTRTLVIRATETWGGEKRHCRQKKKKKSNRKEECSSCSSISFHLSFQLWAELRPIVPGCRFVSNRRNSNTSYVGHHAVRNIGNEARKQTERRTCTWGSDPDTGVKRDDLSRSRKMRWTRNRSRKLRKFKESNKYNCCWTGLLRLTCGPGGQCYSGQWWVRFDELKIILKWFSKHASGWRNSLLLFETWHYSDQEIVRVVDLKKR